MKLAALALLATLACAPGALAGSPDSPELRDEAGDCAMPHAAGYLDITAAWIEQEDAESFVVATSLAAFDAPLAEGAAYTVQFADAGLRWGVVATYRAAQGGWGFFTGQVDMERVNVETLNASEGSFEADTIRIQFPKSIFDGGEGLLTGFFAGSADLRTAYPFLLAGDLVVPDSSDGKWLVCDTAESEATYAYTVQATEAGARSAADAPAPTPAAARTAAPAAGAAPEEQARAVPLPLWLAAGAAALAWGFSRAAPSRPR